MFSASYVMVSFAYFCVAFGRAFNSIAVICIRTSYERTEAMKAKDFILACISKKELLQVTGVAIKMKQDCVHVHFCIDCTDEYVCMKLV